MTQISKSEDLRNKNSDVGLHDEMDGERLVEN